MNNKYLDSLMKLNERDLAYKNEDLALPVDYESIIISESFLRGRNILLTRHKWDMRTMYHALKMYKLAYSYHGAFFINIDGNATLIPEGAVCLVPPDVFHKFTVCDENSCDGDEPIMINILLRSSQIAELLSELLSKKNEVSGYIEKVLKSESHPKFLALLSPSEFTKEIALLFFSETQSLAPPSRAHYNDIDDIDKISTAKCLLNAFILSFFKDSAKIIYSHQTTNPSRPIYGILNCIQTKYRTITLEELCDRFSMTPSYICRLIKQSTGKTFKQYLNSERLSAACRELSLTDKPISVVALDSGFLTLEHFYRVFKASFGVTPAVYRQRAKAIIGAN